MFFNARDLRKSQLPTDQDIMEYLLFFFNQSAQSGASRTIGFADFIVDVTHEVRALWQRLDIPLISDRVIRKKIENVIKRYRDISKTTLQYDVNEWKKLLIVCHCHCAIELNADCQCSPPIPNNVKEFLIDQCRDRLLTLDRFIDNTSPVHFDEPMDMDAAEGASTSVVPMSDSQMPSSSAGYQPTQEELDEFLYNSGGFSPLDDPHPHALKVSDIKLQHFSLSLDRANVSDRMGALLATSLLKDLKEAGIDTGLILDRNKIRRERAKARKQSLVSMKCHELLKCISFDGKRETALEQIVVNGKPRNTKVFEEHVTMVKEPGSKFIGYVTPAKGDAIGIVSAMKDFLTKEEYSLQNLVAILCDGTPTNTGNKNGVICQLERFLERPLQWLVCQFHFNELPFKALVISITGTPRGPTTWPGVIGREAQTCENMPVIDLNFSYSLSIEMVSNLHFFLCLLFRYRSSNSNQSRWALCQTTLQIGKYVPTNSISTEWFELLIVAFVTPIWLTLSLVL